MSERTYGQHCGLAHAMDLIGERWTMLIVRELALGAKRYRDLHDRLPMGTNLLAARLKRLEEAGVVERTTLPAAAGVSAYALTEDGEELRLALEDLTLWGMRLLPELGSGGTVRAAWAALTMQAVARRAGGPGVRGVVEFRVGDEIFWVTCTGDDAIVRDGASPVPADAVATMRPSAFYALGVGRSDAAEAVDAGRVELTGDATLFAKLFETFRLPAPRRRAAAV
jgi:DNA-binding HxlR family transcriptional regulator